MKFRNRRGTFADSRIDDFSRWVMENDFKNTFVVYDILLYHA